MYLKFHHFSLNAIKLHMSVNIFNLKRLSMIYILLLPIITYSQNKIFVGDTFGLNLIGFKNGLIQWQFSPDKQIWVDLEGANKEILEEIASQSGHFRAKVSNCNNVYFSETTYINVYDKYTIGVFGGSLSSTPESESAKTIWLDSLGSNRFKIETKGTGGAGYSGLTKNSIPTQIRNSKPYDIYILWSSTNDYGGPIPVGDFDSQDTISQCGGINYAINLIKMKNENALILLFTSLPVFANYKLAPFVDGQITLCKEKGIPYLNQYLISGFNYSNYSQFYYPDNVHLMSSGYKYIGPMQATFLKKEIYNYYNL